MREIIDLIEIAVLFVVLLGIVLLPFISFLMAIDNYTCGQFGQQTEMQTVYRIPSGCFVQIDGRWVTLDGYYKYLKVEIVK